MRVYRFAGFRLQVYRFAGFPVRDEFVPPICNDLYLTTIVGKKHRGLRTAVATSFQVAPG
jgi:hypothetical protein